MLMIRESSSNRTTGDVAAVGSDLLWGLTPYAATQNFHTPSYSETDLNGSGFALGHR